MPTSALHTVTLALVCLLAATATSASAAAPPASPTVSPATASASASDAEVRAPGYPWQWPVVGPRTVTAPFRAPAHDYGPGHRGMDIAASIGEEVRSPASGIVAFRGTVVDRPLITIDHGEGHVTTLEPVVSELAPGDTVDAGAVVGTVAVGGHAVRETVHVGVRVNDEYVNPRPLFGAVPRAVLLPCCS